MDLQTILNLDTKQFNELEGDELRNVLKILQKRTTTRINRLKHSGVASESEIAFLEKYRVKTKGLSDAELRAEFFKSKDFFSDSKTTVKGLKEYKKEIVKRLESSGIEGVDVSNVSGITSALNRLWEEFPQMTTEFYVRVVKPAMEKYARGKISAEQLEKHIRAEYNKWYEKQEETLASLDFGDDLE